jgi:hypothetical protein
LYFRPFFSAKRSGPASLNLLAPSNWRAYIEPKLYLEGNMKKSVLFIAAACFLEWGCKTIPVSSAKEQAVQPTAVPTISLSKAKNIDPSNETAAKNARDLKQALAACILEKGAAPEKLQDLVPDYISEIPGDGVLNRKDIVMTFTGMGGWYYDKENKSVSINLPG